MQPIIRTPLNYTGNKFKLLPQLLPIFPEKSTVAKFYDCFLGGGTVSVNAPYGEVIGIEQCQRLVGLHGLFLEKTFDELDAQIKLVTAEFNLTCSVVDGAKGDKHIVNKSGFVALRRLYNEVRDPSLLLVLAFYSFNNNLRFNHRGEFNVPVGKRDYNKSVAGSLQTFISQLQTKDSSVRCADYASILSEVGSSDFVYLDPPYLVTSAQYNSTWDLDAELRLHAFMDELNSRGIRFCLSNVLSASDGVVNAALSEWAQKYRVVYLEGGHYNNSSYNKLTRASALEICVLNF